MSARFLFAVFKREKAIITVCNCCFDLYLITNTAVWSLSPQTRTQPYTHTHTQTHTHTHTHISSLSLFVSESSDSTSAVWFGALLSYLPFIYLLYFPSCFLCSRIRRPCPVPTPVHLPARGFRRLPKSRKRRCVINRAKGRPFGYSPSILCLFFCTSFVPVWSRVSSPICVTFVVCINLIKQSCHILLN